jgi:hypothetical protein
MEADDGNSTRRGIRNIVKEWVASFDNNGRHLCQHSLDGLDTRLAPMSDKTNGGYFTEMKRIMFRFQGHDGVTHYYGKSRARRCWLGGKNACHATFEKESGMARHSSLWRVGLKGTFAGRLTEENHRANKLIPALLR